MRGAGVGGKKLGHLALAGFSIDPAVPGLLRTSSRFSDNARLTGRRRRAFAFASALLSAGLACGPPLTTTGEIDPTVLAQAVQDAQNATVVAGLTVTAALPPAATDTPTATETAAPAVTPTPPPSPTPSWNWNGNWAIWLNEDAPSTSMELSHADHKLTGTYHDFIGPVAVSGTTSQGDRQANGAILIPANIVFQWYMLDNGYQFVGSWTSDPDPGPNPFCGARPGRTQPLPCQWP